MLGPLLFPVYIKNLPSLFESPCRIRERPSYPLFGRRADLHTLLQWVSPRGRRVKIYKRAHMILGQAVAADGYTLCSVHLRPATSEKDLGIAVTTSLNPHKQPGKVRASTRSMLRGKNGLLFVFLPLHLGLFMILTSVHY